MLGNGTIIFLADTSSKMKPADFLKFYLAFYRIFFHGRRLHDDNKATHAVRVFFSQAICQTRANFYVHVHLQQANKPQ